MHNFDPNFDPFSDEEDSNPGEVAQGQSPADQISIYDSNDQRMVESGQSDFLIGTIPGIVLAGFLYPTVLMVIFGVFGFFTSPIPGPNEILTLVGGIFFIGGIVGALYAMLTGWMAVILIWAMNKSLGNPFDRQTAAISVGSLAGYTAAIGSMYHLVFVVTTSSLFLMVFLGPFLAISMGAFGANWSSQHLSYQGPLKTDSKRPVKLSIRHLMVGTTWIAATFALANAFGDFGFAVAVAGWFVLNGILLGCVKLYRSFKNKRAATDHA
jgi:hypothetical protein